MNTRSPILVLATALIAGAAGWQAARHFPHSSSEPNHRDSAASGDRKILFYQSAMHPWIKSDKPGKCTICGMDLTPVFEGDAAVPLDPSLVALSSNAISVLHVQSTPVRRGTLVRTLRVAGTLDDDDTRHHILSAWTAGRIDHLAVNYVGAPVAAGQPLARFYSPMLLEAERQYIALFSPADTNPTSHEQQFLRDAAAQRLRQLGLTDSQIEQLPSKSPTNHLSEIVAPSSGTVVERFVYPGQYVMEGEKLFEIADFSVLWFLFDAYEQDLAFLTPGQEIEVQSPSAPGQIFRAPIRFIDPNLSEMTRSARVRVEVTNPLAGHPHDARRVLPHRAYAEGRVRIEIPDTRLVPRSAVLSPADAPVVYIDQGGGIYQQRPVRLGRFGDADYEVLEGLAEGDPVVTQGNLLIDAQAQLNRSILAAEGTSAPKAPTPSHPPAGSTLTGPQVEGVHQILDAADALRAALAADDLHQFHAALHSLPNVLRLNQERLSQVPDAAALLATLAEKSPTTAPTDLRSARKIYHALSVPLVAFARKLRSQESHFQGLKIYRCPMTADAFDGAPSRAEWLQPAPPLRNPWFGSEMLECGVEARD